MLTVAKRVDGTTSALLLVFGVLLVVALLVGAVIVHRRWHDAIG